MKLYRQVEAGEAERTLEVGFEDYRGTYLISNRETDREWSGVWVSDRPLDCNDHGNLDTTVLLEIDLALPESAIFEHQWPEPGKPYREWLIPAALLNGNARVRQVSDEEVEPN